MPVFSRLSALVAALSLTLGFANPVAAQTAASTDSAPAQILVLGVFHFATPNADYARFQGIDVLTPTRQREIEAVVAALARFAPTRIAVERPATEADSLNADYSQYLAGRFDLARNEVHQLGFRLAARLHQRRVYPIDVPSGLAIDSVLAYAHIHDTAYAGRFQRTIASVVQQLDRMQREESIPANLRFLNDSTTLRGALAPYMDMATVGAGDTYVGARVVSQWYERNLRIFAHVATLAQPRDRILLIIGQGHVPILRHLVRSHPGMRLVDAALYLP